LRDIAEMVGVSVSTVSATLNDAPRAEGFSAATKERIRAAAKQLGYVPSPLAQALKKAKKNLLGIVVYNHQDPRLSSMLHAALEEAQILEREVVLMDMGNKADRLNRSLHMLRAWGVQGIVLMLGGHIRSDSSRKLVQDIGVPVVAIASRRRGCVSSAVVYENAEAGRLLAGHLLDLGHKNIGMLAGKPTHIEFEERLEGVREALEQRHVGFGEDQIARTAESRFALPSAYYAADELLEKNPDTTAIICMNDVLAIGAMKRVRELGMKIPGDISVAGFDDFILADDMDDANRLGAYMTPSLTTIRAPFEDMGRAATQMLVELAKDPSGSDRRKYRVFPGTLVVRESTGAAPAPALAIA